MFHILPRRRRLLLMILLCEVALFTLIYKPDYLNQTYFPIKQVPPPAIPKLIPEEGIELLERYAFQSAEDLSSWQEKSFKGNSMYAVVREGERSFLKASSNKSCSGLYHAIQVTVTPDLEVEWSWKVEQFPQKKVPTRFGERGQDDYAARIYLVFPGSNFFKSDVLEYLWDENAPKDHGAASPYSDRIKMMVVTSGAATGDGWVKVRRNILQDYQKLFGRAPQKPLGIIAVMTDSDNTGSQTSASFGELRIFRKAPGSPK